MTFTSNVTVREHRLTSLDETRISYDEYLPVDTPMRADIMMVHGLASSSLQFAEDARHFAERGFRVIVPDLRGHGRSSVPDGPLTPARFTIPIMAQDLIAILDHAEAHAVHWVGNSLGGILALCLLGTPERRRLSSLALFGTCFSMNLPPRIDLALRVAFLPGAAITAWITARMTTSSAAGRTAIETAIRQLNADAGAAIAANVRNYDFVANALAYERQILVLRGGKDHAVNFGLRADIDKFDARANVTRVELPNGGHCANLDMPEVFRAALVTHWHQA